MTVSEARSLGVSVVRDSRQVYDFLAKPENFPIWASGLCSSIERQGEDWIARTPHGPRRVRFTPANPYGVLDHWVVSDDGTEIYVPMRVVPNGSGSEIVITLFREPGMSDERFTEDADWVKRDLAALKGVLEAL